MLLIENDSSQEFLPSPANYMCRLAKHITGYGFSQLESLISQVAKDKLSLHQQLGFPTLKDAHDNPQSYRTAILDIARAHNVRIITFEEVPEEVLVLYSQLRQLKNSDLPNSACFLREIPAVVVRDPETLNLAATC